MIGPVRYHGKQDDDILSVLIRKVRRMAEAASDWNDDPRTVELFDELDRVRTLLEETVQANNQLSKHVIFLTSRPTVDDGEQHVDEAQPGTGQDL